MGASLSWLVGKADSLGEIKRLLRAEDLRKGQKPSLCVTVSPSGQLFVFEAIGRKWTFDSDRERQRLSAGREVYFCMLEERVMESEAALWRGGREIWRVQHSNEKGVFHLEARGQLPATFEEHKRRGFEEQESVGGEDGGVDCVISIPLDIAAECMGYDGDLSDPAGKDFEWVEKAQNGWLRHLIGKA